MPQIFHKVFCTIFQTRESRCNFSKTCLYHSVLPHPIQYSNCFQISHCLKGIVSNRKATKPTFFAYNFCLFQTSQWLVYALERVKKCSAGPKFHFPHQSPCSIPKILAATSAPPSKFSSKFRVLSPESPGLTSSGRCLQTKVSHSQFFCVKVSLCCAKSLQLCLTLCDPVDRSPSGSYAHRILQARILERVASPSSRFPPHIFLLL